MDRVDHFGRDLFVVLDREDRRPLRVQLEEQLRDGVRSGRLHAGTALPSTRALAQELAVARGVVVTLVHMADDGSPDPKPGTFAGLPDYLVRSGGPRADRGGKLSLSPFDLTVAGGRITRIDERYIP